METRKVKPDYASYSLREGSSQTAKVVIQNDHNSDLNFWICGTPDDKQDKFGTIFMLDDAMLVKLRTLIDEYIGD